MIIDDNRPVMVTIRCITFNQAPYIRQCLDGFVMQKTNFRFEAIVHDDASTDGTADIVREYSEKYPDIIRPIIETENQFTIGGFQQINKMIYPLIRGKYLADCEGDDYWTDPLKLQKQVDYLESHPECTLTLSNGYGYIEKEKLTVLLNPIPIKESRVITMHEVLKEKNGLIPTASMLFRKEMVESEPDWCLRAPVGDRPLRMWCAINGTVYYDVTPMVTYRKGSIGSFTQRVTNIDYARSILDKMNVFFDAFDEYTKKEYHEDVQYMKNREEYYYYIRISDYKALRKCDFFNNLPLIERLKMQAKAKFPNFYLFLKGLRDSFINRFF